ncbi:MAG: zinc-ribbon domain-containing protein [Promethearchaeota archaeon]
MGFGRVVWSGIVGMILLALFSWVSFSLLDLTSSITGGLIDDLNVALSSLGTLLPGGGFLSILLSMFLGLIMILLFPIHWCLYYRPDDVLLLVSVILPWILACTVASALSAKTPKKAIHTSLAIGIGFIIVTFVIYFLIPLILGRIAGIGSLVVSVIDGLSEGLTDLPFLLASFTAILEGCLVGTVFGAFIGSLRYKPAGGKKKVKKKEKKVEVSNEPTLDSAAICSNCGAKIPPGVDFCTNCGAKVN